MLALGWQQACLVSNTFQLPLFLILTLLRSKHKIGEQRITVDFDAEKGRQPRPDREADKCYVVIRPTTSIRMAVISAYLAQQIQFDKSVLEAISEFFIIPSIFRFLTFNSLP